MKQLNRGNCTLIGLAIVTLVTVVSPCLAGWDTYVWEDTYITSSPTYTAPNGTYGRTASFTSNYVTDPLDYNGVKAVMYNGMLTAWVDLQNVEDDVSSSAYSYTLGGVTWEYDGPPGTAPPVTVDHRSHTDGEVWAYGWTDDAATGSPYPSLSVEADAEGVARVVSDLDDTQASGYAVGWVDGKDEQSTAYAILIGYQSQSPATWSQVSGINGEFDYDVQYWLYFNDSYETASGLSEIDAIAGVNMFASASGSASDIGENNATDVYGEGGVWHGYSWSEVTAGWDE